VTATGKGCGPAVRLRGRARARRRRPRLDSPPALSSCRSSGGTSTPSWSRISRRATQRRRAGRFQRGDPAWRRFRRCQHALLAIGYVFAVAAWLWPLRDGIRGPDVSTGVMLIGAAVLLAWLAGFAGTGIELARRAPAAYMAGTGRGGVPHDRRSSRDPARRPGAAAHRFRGVNVPPLTACGSPHRRRRRGSKPSVAWPVVAGVIVAPPARNGRAVLRSASRDARLEALPLLRGQPTASPWRSGPGRDRRVHGGRPRRCS
jgi:hypothetical protein